MLLHPGNTALSVNQPVGVFLSQKIDHLSQAVLYRIQHNTLWKREFILMNLEAVIIYVHIVALIIAGFLFHVEKEDAAKIFGFIAIGSIVVWGLLFNLQ